MEFPPYGFFLNCREENFMLFSRLTWLFIMVSPDINNLEKVNGNLSPDIIIRRCILTV
jgi:hypothetical protein